MLFRSTVTKMNKLLVIFVVLMSIEVVYQDIRRQRNAKHIILTINYKIKFPNNTMFIFLVDG